MFCFAREERETALCHIYLVYKIVLLFLNVAGHERPCVSDLPGWNLGMQCHPTTLARRLRSTREVMHDRHLVLAGLGVVAAIVYQCT